VVLAGVSEEGVEEEGKMITFTKHGLDHRYSVAQDILFDERYIIMTDEEAISLRDQLLEALPVAPPTPAPAPNGDTVPMKRLTTAEAADLQLYVRSLHAGARAANETGGATATLHEMLRLIVKALAGSEP
jgi:hypothetical protein